MTQATEGTDAIKAHIETASQAELTHSSRCRWTACAIMLMFVAGDFLNC